MSETNKETKTYKIEASPRQHKELEQILSYINYLGSIGHTSSFNIYVDGDGGARIKAFDENDNRLLDINDNIKLLNEKMNTDRDIDSFDIY